MYKGISNVPPRHPSHHGRSRVKKTNTSKQSAPLVSFKKWDLDLSVAVLIAVLAFTAAVGRVMASSLEPATIQTVQGNIVKTLTDSAQPQNKFYQFRTVPHMVSVPVYTTAPGQEHTLTLSVVNPGESTRFAFVVISREPGAVRAADKPNVPSDILKEIKKEGFRWRALPTSGSATYTWVAPARVGNDPQFVDIVAFVGRERDLARAGAIEKKVFARDYALIRYELQPSEDDTAPVVNQSGLVMTLSASNPEAQTFESGRKNKEILTFDIVNTIQDPLTVSEVKITLQPQNANELGITQEMLQKAFTNVTVTQGGELWGTAQLTTSTASHVYATIPAGSRVIMPGEKKTIHVFLDLANYDNTGNMFSGFQFRAGAHVSLAQKIEEPKETVFGSLFTVRGGILSAEWKGDTPNGFSIGGTKQIIGKFRLSFKSLSGRLAVIKNISVDVSSTIASTAERNLIVYKDSVADRNELGRYTWKPGQEIAGVVSLASFIEQNVPNDGTKEYVIALDTIGARAQNTVQVTIPENGVMWTDFGAPIFATVVGAPLPIKTLSY